MAAVRRAEAELERSGSPSNAAIAQRAGLSEHNVRFLRGAARVTASLDEPVGEHTTALGDFIPDQHAVDSPERATAREEHGELSAMQRRPDAGRIAVPRGPERHSGAFGKTASASSR